MKLFHAKKLRSGLKTLFSHISVQIIMIVGTTVVLVLLCTVMFFYHSTVKIIRTNAVRSNEIILEQFNNGFETYIAELKNFTLNVRMDSGILSIIESPDIGYIEQETLGNYMKAMFYSRHDLYDISVHMLRNDTMIRFSRDTKKVSVSHETNIEQEDWFLAAASSPDYSCIAPYRPDVCYPEESFASSAPFLRIYRVIINAYTKKPLAVVEATCDMSIMNSIIKDLGQDKSSLFRLSDQDGTPYFLNSPQLKDLPVFPLSTEDTAKQESVMFRNDEYLCVTHLSRDGRWLLTKLISVDTLTAQNISSRNISLLVLITATVISITAIAFLVHLLTRSLKRLSSQMDQAGKGDLKTTLEETGSYETRMLAHRYNAMIRQIDELIQKNYVMALGEKTAKLQALESQVNPHFLYNSLQVISSRTIVTGDREIYKMIEALAANLRYAFKESVLVPVSLEVQYVRNYLLLLKARFEDRLSTDIEAGDDVSRIMIPKLAIFTLIENSVSHGLETSMKQLRMELKVQLDQGSLIISVTDNGPGIPPDTLERIITDFSAGDTLVSNGEHIGLRNLNTRLKIYYGDRASLRLRSNPGIRTEAVITIHLTDEETTDACITH